MAETWTIRRVLKWTTGFFERKGIDSARLDAELLIGQCLDMARIMLYADIDKPLKAEELESIRALVKRRAAFEPTAYILGRKGFWKQDLEVDARVLVPRPETERLVELALERLKDRPSPTILDVGTGSGCIALAIAAERPDATVIGIDRSTDALAVARANAKAMAVENVSFQEGDLLDGVELTVDLIVSNPPYIPSHEVDQLMPDVLQYEPRLALDGGDDGLDLIRRLVAQSATRLLDDGVLLMEMAIDQGARIKALLLAQPGFVVAAIHQDYTQRDRITEGRRA